MHEMGIALEIIKIATDSIPGNLKKSKVEKINLKVGKLAAVVPDSLKFCFEVAAKNTPLEGAILHIEIIPVTARCKHCGYFWTAIQPVFICEKCDSGSVDLLSGRELDIVSIEVEETSGDS
jgi:hydrogenase nickel incorporation protein HypA/HybF